jgi:DNA-binding XRE family transcriptional regulator
MVSMVDINKIEELRIEHGYSQEQLAKMIGYGSRSTYNCKIKGSRQFTIEDIVNICKVFELEPNDLIIMD